MGGKNKNQRKMAPSDGGKELGKGDGRFVGVGGMRKERVTGERGKGGGEEWNRGRGGDVPAGGKEKSEN